MKRVGRSLGAEVESKSKKSGKKREVERSVIKVGG